jgi:hypothetical protein
MRKVSIPVTIFLFIFSSIALGVQSIEYFDPRYMNLVEDLSNHESVQSDYLAGWHRWMEQYRATLLRSNRLPYRNVELLSKIAKGTRLSRAYIVTHASSTELGDKIAEYFETDPKALDAPRIILASLDFPVHSQKLLQQSTVVRFSDGGELQGLVVNADEIHLMGGYAMWCMSNTLENLLNQWIDSNREKLDVVIHANLTYIERPRTSPRLAPTRYLGDLPQTLWMAKVFQETLNPFGLKDFSYCGFAVEQQITYQLANRKRSGLKQILRIRFDSR